MNDQDTYNLDCSKPEDVATALRLLNTSVDRLREDLFALAGLLGVLVGRASPKGERLHTAALEAIQVIQGGMPNAHLTAVVAEALRLASTPPPTDGGGLPIEETASNVVAMLRKVA